MKKVTLSPKRTLEFGLAKIRSKQDLLYSSAHLVSHF